MNSTSTPTDDSLRQPPGGRVSSIYLYVAQLAAAIAGAALSVYLLVQHTRLKSGIQDGSSFCNFGRFANCDVVNSSSWSELFGVPIAAIGAVFYFAILVLAAMGRPGRGAHPRIQRLIGWLSGFALVEDFVLSLVQAFRLQSFCVFCIGTYLCSLVLFLTAARMSGGVRRLFFGETEGDWPETSHLIAGLVATVGFAIGIGFLPTVVRQQSPVADPKVQEKLNAFYQSLPTLPTRDIPIGPGDGVYGNPAAKVKLVEFSDFQCPFCRRAAATFHRLLEPFKDRVYFVFKHFPLDTACNATMPRQLHSHACWAAMLASCAAKKGNFWRIHDRLFLEMTDDDFEEGRAHLEKMMEPVMSAAEQSACIADPEAARAVQIDLETGRSVDVNATPFIYVNGKHVTIPLSADSLKRIVEIEEGAKP